MAAIRHRFERRITLASARRLRAGAGRPSPLFRRHRLRTMVNALRQARRDVRGKGRGTPHTGLPLRLRWRRAVAGFRAWVARRLS